MALSDFLNSHTSVSLYSRYYLNSHSVRVAQKSVVLYKKNVVLHKKLCCVNKKNVSHRSYVAHQNYVSHKRICCGNKKNCVTPKKEGHVD